MNALTTNQDVNIGPRGVARRRFAGLVVAAIALSGFAAIRIGDAHVLWHLALFPLFWFAALCLLQAGSGT